MLLLLQDQHRHDDVDGCVWVVYYCFAETDIAVFQQLQGLLSLVRDFKVENSRLVVEVISEEKLMIAAG